MNGKPTAEQKRFHQWCIDKGCILTATPASLHHIQGARMKLKGVDNAGEWYVLPVSFYWHQDLSNDNAIHKNRKRFEGYWKKNEKAFWIDLIMHYEFEHGVKPMQEHEYQIILDRA